jgi:hypothetical protein
MNKTCTKCGETKDIGEFPPNRAMRDGYRSDCRPCVNKANRERDARKAPKSARALNYRLKHEGKKHCVYCDTTKMLDEFPLHDSTGDKRGKCLQCTRDGRMKSQYGVTRKQYDDMLEAQGGCCAICGSTTPRGRHKTFVVDHDHSCCPGDRSCGACVRGLLCSTCNIAIGLLGDDAAGVRSALSYLEAS